MSQPKHHRSKSKTKSLESGESKDIPKPKKKKPKKQETTVDVDLTMPKSKKKTTASKSPNAKRKRAPPSTTATTATTPELPKKSKRKVPKVETSKESQETEQPQPDEGKADVGLKKPELESEVSTLPVTEPEPVATKAAGQPKKTAIIPSKPETPVKKPKSKSKKPKSTVKKAPSTITRPKSNIQKVEYIPKAEPNIIKTEPPVSKHEPPAHDHQLTIHKPDMPAHRPEPTTYKPVIAPYKHDISRKPDSLSHKPSVNLRSSFHRESGYGIESPRSSRIEVSSTHAKDSLFQERENEEQAMAASKSLISYIDKSLIYTLCCWLPVRYYELWIIFSITGFFSLWIVLMFLSCLYLFYGIILCNCGFTLMFRRDTLTHWLQSVDSSFKFDPLFQFNSFEFELYVKQSLNQACSMFFKHGLLFIFLGFVQCFCHIHGFYSFYFRHAINLLFYAIALFGFSIILFVQMTYFASITDHTIKNVFKLRMVDILDERECHICVPPANVTTANWTKLSDTDFVLKLQSCVLKCCGYNEDENSLPLEGMFDPIPIVCCKEFHPLMFRKDDKFSVPSQLKCYNEMVVPNVTLPLYPFSGHTCRPDQRIPPCENTIKNNFYYTSTLRFTNFVLIYLNVLGIYYFLFFIICLFYFVERFYTRRRILKDIHDKLTRYQIDTSVRTS